MFHYFVGLALKGSTHLRQMFPFQPPENVRKPDVNPDVMMFLGGMKMEH